MLILTFKNVHVFDQEKILNTFVISKNTKKNNQILG